MRVAVHIPPGHPEHGGGVDGDAVVPYQLGRIEDGIHNAPIGHDPLPLEKFVAGLVERARADYPGCEIRVERMINNGDGTASWIAAEEFDPAIHTAQGAGNVRGATVTVVADQTGAAA